MSQWWWYFTRATGIVAAVLAVAALAWGLLFSARETGTRLRPAWWLDLHSWLGGLTLTFTTVHVVASYADRDLGLRLLDLVVPGVAKHQTTPLAWGVLAFLAFAVVTLTSLARVKRTIARRTWHLIHLFSVPAVVAMGAHAYQTGSDASTFAFLALFVVVAGTSVYPLAIRLLGLGSKRRPPVASGDAS